jgi:hypothetical protein
MKDAETRDIGKVGDRDVSSEMLFDICENTPQPYVIQPMWCQCRQPNELRLGVRMRQPRREQQLRRFHEHAARGRVPHAGADGRGGRRNPRECSRGPKSENRTLADQGEPIGGSPVV